MSNLFSPLACAKCGRAFPENVIPNSCPECGSISYKNERSSLSVRLSMDNSYSKSHITSAALHARNSGALEDEYGGEIYGINYLSENEAFVTAAIFHAVAFLEATANEFFADIAEEGDKEFLQLYGESIVMQFERFWKMGIPRTASYPVLQKYEIALVLTHKEVFDKGTEVYQNANLLIALHNYLIHAEPETHTLFTIGEIEPHKAIKPSLSEGLKNKFPVNRIMKHMGNPFFPYKCLGHGCAEWAVKSVLKLTDVFFSRIGLKPPYEGLRDKLNTN